MLLALPRRGFSTGSWLTLAAVAVVFGLQLLGCGLMGVSAQPDLHGVSLSIERSADAQVDAPAAECHSHSHHDHHAACVQARPATTNTGGLLASLVGLSLLSVRVPRPVRVRGSPDTADPPPRSGRHILTALAVARI